VSRNATRHWYGRGAAEDKAVLMTMEMVTQFFRDVVRRKVAVMGVEY